MTITTAHTRGGEGMSRTISLTREQLEERRRQILDNLNMSDETLRSRAETYTLQPSERQAFEALRAIDYLLHGE